MEKAKKAYIKLLKDFSKSEEPIPGLLKAMDEARNKWIQLINENNHGNKS